MSHVCFPTTRTDMDEHDVHVWMTWLHDPGRGEGGADLLSDDELRRSARLPERFGSRFVAGRAFLRRVVSSYVGRHPSEVQFGYGPQGKPELIGDPATLRFSLSHSRGLAVCAIAPRRAIGVDVEAVTDTLFLDRISKRFFAPDECAALANAEGPRERNRVFALAWTKREAALKMLELPLATPREQLAIDREGSPGRGGPTLHEIEPIDGWVGAIAVGGPIRTLTSRWISAHPNLIPLA